jgi:hypothetical protein
MKFFDVNDHLNEEGISLYVEALVNDTLHKLPIEVVEHVEKCFKCKRDIIEIYDMLDEAKHIMYLKTA